MSNLTLKNQHLLAIAGMVIVILIVGVVGFLIRRSKEQAVQIPLAYKEQCEKAGAAWVAENPYPWDADRSVCV